MSISTSIWIPYTYYKNPKVDLFFWIRPGRWGEIDLQLGDDDAGHGAVGRLVADRQRSDIEP